MKMKKSGKVYLVGAGPGDAGLMTLRGAELLSQADAVVYDRLINPELLKLSSGEKIAAGKSHDVEPSGRKKFPAQEKINRLLAKLAKQGKTVVRLKGGDPFIFGRGGEEASYLAKNKIDFEIVPGVSSGYAVPAYAGIPVTDRRFASQVIFVTAHEDPKKKGSAVDWEKLAQFNGTLVAFMGIGNLSSVAQTLIKAGKPASTPVSVIEWGTFPEQRVVAGTLKDISSKVRREKIQSPSIMVIGDVNRFREELDWFKPSPCPLPKGEGKGEGKKALSGKTILITRAAVQAGSLRKILEEKGARVLECATIKILPPENWGPVDRILTQLQKFDWIVFTSTNGVESFFNRLDLQNKDARALSGNKIAVVGRATADFLREKGISADLMPARFTSEDLFQELLRKREVNGRIFLLVRGALADDNMPFQLKESGAEVTEAIVYRTQPAPQAGKKLEEFMTREKIDYITFASSSAVRNFFECFPAPKRSQIKVPFISIGPVTSKTLSSFGHKPYREAREHTIPGLVEAVINGKK